MAKVLIWMFIISILLMEGLALAYNSPKYAKVQVVRDPAGQSYLELKFRWSSEAPPNFAEGIAVEFEIHIDNKCFVQPVGGKDDNHWCDTRLKKKNFILPNDVIPELGEPNCYVDVWNYWSPPWDQIGAIASGRCGGLDFMGMDCITALATVNKVVDPEANFAVGLHEANKLQAGKTYWFKYPVEVNNTSECQQKYGSAIDEGLAWVNMQTFSNTCLLTSNCTAFIGSLFHEYTCPELIGATEGCRNADKQNFRWINNLCVPTGIVDFTPEVAVVTDTKAFCEGENGEGHHTAQSCCVDQDNDGYFKTQAVPTFGSKTGDCNDSNNKINPGATEVCLDNVDDNCDGDLSCVIACSNCTGICGDGICDVLENQSICCQDCGGCPNCSNGQTMDCGLCGASTCSNGTWGTCTNQGICNPGDTKSQPCNGNGTQSHTCNNSCQWGPWSACQGGCGCNSGVCCDGCNYYNSSTVCDQSYVYQCQGPNPGQDAQQALVQQYCSGSSTSCNGQTQQGSWQTAANCSSSEVCQMSGGVASCVPAPCMDVYLASSLSACSSNPQGSGNPTLCLEVQQSSGAQWQYRVCKQGSSFGNNFTYHLQDDNYGNLWGTYSGISGSTCSGYQTADVSYINGYGSANGAGLMIYLTSPSGCIQSTCQYHTGIVTISKQCQ